MEKPRMRGRHGLVDHRRPGKGPRHYRDQIEADRGCQPFPLDRTERVSDLAPVGAAPVDGGGGAHERGHDGSDPHPRVAGQPVQEPPHAVAALRPAPSVTTSYTATRRSAIESHP